VAQALDVIERNVNLQAQLIDDLLDLSLITSGKLVLHKEVVDANEIIKAALQTVQRMAEVRKIRLQTQLAEPLPLLEADQVRLQQVMWNLLINAIKFTEPGGAVYVSSLVNNGNIEIVVKDTGLCMAQEFLPFIFNRFWQADSSISRRHTGLGWGCRLLNLWWRCTAERSR